MPGIDRRTMLAARAAPVLLLLAALGQTGCAKSRRTSAREAPWSHAYADAPDGWWIPWHGTPGTPLPFNAGTRFELETLGPHGLREMETVDVVSISAGPTGAFTLFLKSSRSDSPYRSVMPLPLAYTPGSHGVITARSESLSEVTVPAGTFRAGRLWRSERMGSTPYERDEWVVADLPVPVQRWSRPASATTLYDPPSNGEIPDGTQLTRLVRIDRK